MLNFMSNPLFDSTIFLKYNHTSKIKTAWNGLAIIQAALIRTGKKVAKGCGIHDGDEKRYCRDQV